MQRLAVEQRRLLGPRAPWHVGDIAWGLRDGGDVRVWEEDGSVVAWSWLHGGELDVDVRADRRELLDEALAEPEAKKAWAFEDDDDTRAVLERHGFVQPGDVLRYFARDLRERPVAPALPDGFAYRIATADDIAERVDVHREVWHPSRVTEDIYAHVRTTAPFRESLDCVVEAPDGRFAAYCLIWPDDENRVGELEPVGVRSDFRRRGLGAAVCTYALARLWDEGGRGAIVYCVTDEACSLYASIGFVEHAQLVAYARA
jgi:ribosomal protein S18 acetylase RimI-like enzyme